MGIVQNNYKTGRPGSQELAAQLERLGVYFLAVALISGSPLE